jgi:recombination protein RecT
VYTGDYFDFSYGKNHHLDHQPKWKSLDPAFVYADYELDNGGYDFAVWSWDAILKHANEFSDSFESEWSPWKSSQTSAEEMAKKTVLKTLLKYGPRSVEVADITKAINYDEAAVIPHKIQNGAESTISYEVQHFVDPKSDAVKQSPPTGSAEKAPVDNGKGMPPSKVFDADEAAHLEEQYQQSQGVPPPDFSR